MAGGDSQDPHITEWQEARNIISGVDGRLATLRQYGLSFVTGLLAAQGLIDFSNSGSTSSVPLGVKFAILVASVLIIAALYDLDRRELAIQAGAVKRASTLEKLAELNFGLTDSITCEYAKSDQFGLANILYVLFVVATGILGVSVLNLSHYGLHFAPFYLSWMSMAFLLAVIITVGLLLYDFRGEFQKRRKLLDYCASRK